MNKLGFGFALFFMVATTAFAYDLPMVDDSDISSPGRKAAGPTSNAIHPDRIDVGAAQAGLNLVFVRLFRGQETAIDGLNYQNQKVCNTPTVDVKIKLDSERFKVMNGSGAYEYSFTAKCGVIQKVVVNEDSDAGQVFGIWQIAYSAQKKLNQEVGLAFWKNKIGFNFPADGDYYSFGTVNITLGHQWDVVSHELGHAIYDQAKIGAFGGGSHKIDECYSEALALSEGWASFFAAWLNIGLNDGDAKFEFMVPRRAPIRIETIPADVCGKSTNEWRVTGFLWDLIDLHRDPEGLNETFTRLFADTLNQKVKNVTDMKNKLLARGWSSQEMDLIWKLNFPAETK